MKLIEKGSKRFELQSVEDGAQVVIHLGDGLKLVVDCDHEPSLSVCSKRDAVLPVYDGTGEELCFIPVLRSSRDG